MHIYYLDREDEESEINLLSQDLNISLSGEDKRNLDDTEKEVTANHMKNTLFQKNPRRAREP